MCSSTSQRELDAFLRFIDKENEGTTVRCHWKIIPEDERPSQFRLTKKQGYILLEHLSDPEFADQEFVYDDRTKLFWYMDSDGVEYPVDPHHTLPDMTDE